MQNKIKLTLYEYKVLFQGQDYLLYNTYCNVLPKWPGLEQALTRDEWWMSTMITKPT